MDLEGQVQQLITHTDLTLCKQKLIKLKTSLHPHAQHFVDHWLHVCREEAVQPVI